MEQQLLTKWIDHPENLNKESLYELRALLAQYPFFQTARLLYLKNLYLLHDLTFGEELRKAALYITDVKVLFYMIEGSNYVIKPIEQEDIEPKETSADRTLMLINRFLQEQHVDETEEKSLTSIEVPIDVHSDYASLLSSQLDDEEQQPKMKGQGLIDDFLEKTEASTGEKEIADVDDLLEQEEISMHESSEEDEAVSGKELPTSEDAPVLQEITESISVDDDGEEESANEIEETEDESFFTETLAKIYVKQHRYLKALEIIKKLNLKYPKKNAYFADQIRFLEKLIINTKSE